MNKKPVERIKEINMNLKKIQNNVSWLKEQINTLKEINDGSSEPNSKFKIKHFEQGDLS